MDVAGANVAGELGLPELLHDLEAAEDLAGALGEQPQDLELGAGQVDGLAADGDEVAGKVDRHVAGVDALAVLLSDTACPIELAPAELGAHAAEQLADAERLRHVVVGADLEADDLVDLGVLRRQQDDRNGAAAADVAADVEAAAARHHDVEDEQVEVDVGADLRVGVVAVCGELDLEALLTERVAN